MQGNSAILTGNCRVRLSLLLPIKEKWIMDRQQTLHEQTPEITAIVLQAREKARQESSNEPEPGLTTAVTWPVQCTIGPGLEGAIACETKIGYVNGQKGWLVYRGYDIFDLCAYSTFEEVSYLLLYGKLPTAAELAEFNDKMNKARHIPYTLRLLNNFPVQEMNPMAALRIGTNMMRQRLTWRDMSEAAPDDDEMLSLGTDEDSITQETDAGGNTRATYEFKKGGAFRKPEAARPITDNASGIDSCIRLISGMSVLTAAISRIRGDHLPIEWRTDLSHAANFLYMLTGRVPTPAEERIMDIALILHADHGMNASTFAAMVVASTLSDIYFSVGAGIGALNGPLHGGANASVMKMLKEIGNPEAVADWFEKKRAAKAKVPGFGHRVYKAYDPRARILAPLAEFLAKDHPDAARYLAVAKTLEQSILDTLGKEKKIFPNVDYYSGIVYSCLGIPDAMFTPVFAVSRISGWTARVLEYIENNRIFRPRAVYTGSFEDHYKPLADR